ncbi:MAG: hypothetical protein ACI81R_000464 [Bradymonadia bacterium]|jgi:hypothetical protein
MSGKWRRILLGILRPILTVLLVLACVSIALNLYLERFWHPENQSSVLPPTPSALRELQTVQHAERLEAAIDVYRLQHGEFPETLEQVADEGLLGDRALRYPGYRSQWYYAPTLRGYELYPPLL